MCQGIVYYGDLNYGSSLWHWLLYIILNCSRYTLEVMHTIIHVSHLLQIHLLSHIWHTWFCVVNLMLGCFFITHSVENESESIDLLRWLLLIWIEWFYDLLLHTSTSILYYNMFNIKLELFRIHWLFIVNLVFRYWQTFPVPFLQFDNLCVTQLEADQIKNIWTYIFTTLTSNCVKFSTGSQSPWDLGGDRIWTSQTCRHAHTHGWTSCFIYILATYCSYICWYWTHKWVVLCMIYE